MIHIKGRVTNIHMRTCKLINIYLHRGLITQFSHRDINFSPLRNLRLPIKTISLRFHNFIKLPLHM